MEKKSFLAGFLFAAALALAAALWLRDAPIEAEAATNHEELGWCQGPSEGYGDSTPTGFALKNTWAIITADFVVNGSGEEYAREQACSILFNVYHPDAR